MYLIPKGPQVDQKDGSSYLKIIKTINKSIGKFRRNIALRWDKKKKQNGPKALPIYLQNIKTFVLSWKLKYWQKSKSSKKK